MKSDKALYLLFTNSLELAPMLARSTPRMTHIASMILLSFIMDTIAWGFFCSSLNLATKSGSFMYALVLGLDLNLNSDIGFEKGLLDEELPMP